MANWMDEAVEVVRHLRGVPAVDRRAAASLHRPSFGVTLLPSPHLYLMRVQCSLHTPTHTHHSSLSLSLSRNIAIAIAAADGALSTQLSEGSKLMTDDRSVAPNQQHPHYATTCSISFCCCYSYLSTALQRTIKLLGCLLLQVSSCFACTHCDLKHLC